ncbi:MAG: cyclic nucleotide-binding domain-containing protein [Deltaproteobacteria bacterium]|nr:cyclic nucleotide-binding domain-containing protein [Deltaproteobacteria bacterium]
MSESDRQHGNEELIHYLSQLPSLQSFEEKDLEGLVRMSEVRKYEPGEFIIDEKFNDNWIYFLVSGIVRIVKEGKEIRVLRRRGDIFGEMAVIDGSERSASAYAIDETVCLALDASYMDRLSDTERSVFYSILYKTFAEILAERLRLTTEELVRAKEEIDRLQGM